MTVAIFLKKFMTYVITVHGKIYDGDNVHGKIFFLGI